MGPDDPKDDLYKLAGDALTSILAVTRSELLGVDTPKGIWDAAGTLIGFLSATREQYAELRTRRNNGLRIVKDSE
jgi:hypothetical protein